MVSTLKWATQSFLESLIRAQRSIAGDSLWKLTTTIGVIGGTAGRSSDDLIGTRRAF